MDTFPQADVSPDASGDLVVNTHWRIDPDETKFVYLHEEPQYCKMCGVELGSGDPHNPEAHIAEMRADERFQEEIRAGMWQPDEPDYWPDNPEEDENGEGD